MSSYIRSILATAFLALFLHGSEARADWINLTGAETSPNIAEITILDDRVRLVLEAYIGDLTTFRDLVPEEWLKDTDVERPDIEDRLRRFSIETFQFIPDGSEPLQAELMLVEPRLRKDRYSPFAGMVNPSTRRRVPEAPADKRVLYAELEYPFSGEPKTLTIIPPRDDSGRVSVSMGFIAYHKAVPIIDFRYLSSEVKVNLDWADPWYSRFDNPNLKRHHKSALMSFLYVEPYEVRHEILTRVKDLENWMDFGLRGDRYIEPDELEPLKQRIGEFLLDKNPVRVDGVALKPILDRSNYVKVAISGIQLLERPQRLEISTAIVGVIIAYITDGLPKQVTVDWELFTDQVERVPATAIDPAGPLPSFVTPDDNVLTWTNFLKSYVVPKVEEVTLSEEVSHWRVPLASVICLLVLLILGALIINRQRRRLPVRFPLVLAVAALAGAIALYPYGQVAVARPLALAPPLSQADSRTLLGTLLKNTYRAFDFREEDDVYDKLALTVSGELLSDVYLQSRKSFAVQRAGGAQAKVREVEVLESDARRLDDRDLAYVVKARWTALGTVGHWGHVHVRKNLYDARVTVEAKDGAWKITGLELLEERRIDPYAKPASE